MALLERLVVRDFRNVARLDAEFPAEGAALVGENGHGKTNLLEAIHYFHALGSMRGARDSDLVRFGVGAFHLRARLAGAARPVGEGVHEIAVGFDRGASRKKVVVDGSEIRRLSSALGALPSVVIAPRDVELVTGAPSVRRRFLDVLLALTSPGYLAALQGYRAALARRNAALRAAARSGRVDDTVAVWEPALAESGAVLVAARAEWVRTHATGLGRHARAIGEGEPVAMHYVTPVESTASAHDELLAALERRRTTDVRYGATQSGPHRDDLALLLGGHELGLFGSAGQQRTAAIALRLLERETLRAAHAGEPLLLLDDPFAELDARRSARVLALLHDDRGGQTFLAVPRESDVPADFTRLPRWRVVDGMAEPAMGGGGT